MTGQQWYRHYAARFLRGVQGIGAGRIGAYIVILDLIYARGGPIKRDDRHLAGVLGESMRQARSLTDGLISAGKLVETEGRWANPTDDEELEKQAEVSRAFTESGAKGGRTSAKSRQSAAPAEPEKTVEISRNLGERSAKSFESSVKYSENDARAPEINDIGQGSLKHRARGEENRRDIVREERGNPGSEQDAQGLDANGRVHTPTALRQSLPEGKVGDVIEWVVREARMGRTPPDAVPIVEGWFKSGARLEEDIYPTVDRMIAAARQKRQSIGSLRYFDRGVRDSVAAYHAEADADIARWSRTG